MKSKPVKKTDLDLKVDKIMTARAIQKTKIEDADEALMEYKSNLAEANRPVTDKLEEMQLIQNKTNEILQNRIEAIPGSNLPALTEENKISMLQQIIQEHAKDKQVTKLEISFPSGKLGNDEVDIPTLINNQKLHLKKANITLDINSPGLIALLTLTHKDLKSSKIIPSVDDISIYNEIMQSVGYGQSRNEKYLTYIKPFRENVTERRETQQAISDNESLEGNEMDEFYDAGDQTIISLDQSIDPATPVKSNLLEVPKLEVLALEKPPKDTTLKKQIPPLKRGNPLLTKSQLEKRVLPKPLPHHIERKSGTGVGTACNKHLPQMKARLTLLFGSLEAGNNSRKIKDEAHDIIDELLQAGEITFSMHNKLYLQLNV